MHDSDYSIEKALEARKEARLNRKTFVLTNGCFDILHAGHASSLIQAREFGDVLWVGVNSDSSVRKIKGKCRPIISQNDRAFLLKSLNAVSGTFIFEGSDLSIEIDKIKPDIYVKSSDYTLETINPKEKKALENNGVQVKFVPMIGQVSTSSIITKIKNET